MLENDAAFIAGLVLFVGWLLATLVRALRAERTDQPVARRTPITRVVVMAVAIIIASVWIFDDPRAGFRVGMFGIVFAASGMAIIKSRPLRFLRRRLRLAWRDRSTSHAAPAVRR